MEWCSAGARVEVLQTEEGLAGSRYIGRVLEQLAHHVHIEFEVCLQCFALQIRELSHLCYDIALQAFTVDGSPDELLKEWVEAKLLRKADCGPQCKAKEQGA